MLVCIILGELSWHFSVIQHLMLWDDLRNMVIILFTMIMVHNGTSSSYRLVNWVSSELD